MNEKAKEIIQLLKDSGKDYSVWDLTCLSCIVLIGVAEITPEIKQYVKPIVGKLMDGNIQLRQSLSDGILPIKS